MNFSDMLDQLLNGKKKITVEKIKENTLKTPRRICFDSCHRDALKKIEKSKDNTCIGALNVPFDSSIKYFIEQEAKLNLIEKKNGLFWCPANSDEEFQRLTDFFEKHKKIVFLRDTLECSIALSENFKDDERTFLGKMEYEAKYSDCSESIEEIKKAIIDFINNSEVYGGIPYICSIPSSKPEEKNLPQKLSEMVSDSISNLTDISQYISWKNSKPEIKSLDLDEKLEALIKTDLEINNFEIKNEDIILIDDLYQSGTTMQYVAMKLKELGARRIFGLSIVKSQKNTDNQ